MGGPGGSGTVGADCRGKDSAVQIACVEMCSSNGRALATEDLVEKTAQSQSVTSLWRGIWMGGTGGSGSVGDSGGSYGPICGAGIEGGNGDGRIMAVEDFMEKTAQSQSVASL